MTGQIGQIAEEVLQEVKDGKLVKLAEHVIVEDAEKKAAARTPLGRAALKLAAVIRSASSDVTINELKQFVDRIQG